MTTSARFIALEGIDGSGTTTQMSRLAHALRSQGFEVTTTAEPSQGPVGVSCRQALSAQPPLNDGALALMFAADRLDHLARCIEPALQAGHIVLCDRYLLSTLAYQGLTLPQPWLEAINSRSRVPDATVLLQEPTRVAQQRMHSRKGVTEQFDAQELQERIAARYRQLAASAHNLTGPVHVLDGQGTQQAVTERLVGLVQKFVC